MAPGGGMLPGCPLSPAPGSGPWDPPSRWNHKAGFLPWLAAGQSPAQPRAEQPGPGPQPRDCLGPAQPEGFKRRERGRRGVEETKDAVRAKHAVVARALGGHQCPKPPATCSGDSWQAATPYPLLFWGSFPEGPRPTHLLTSIAGEGPVPGSAGGVRGPPLGRDSAALGGGDGVGPAGPHAAPSPARASRTGAAGRAPAAVPWACCHPRG